jgi:drug/metabolite transporter (DMT)-like permease
MIKSSTPVWVLIFSFLFGFEKAKLNLILIISIIVFGVWLTIDGEPKFDFQGFILVLIAAIASGLRWNMTQYLMKNRKSPITTMYHLSPIMFITMLLLSFLVERPLHYNTGDIDITKSIISIFIMAIGGILAFIMTMAELYLIKGTNTVTLSVAGISKEIVVISLSVFIYGDVLTTKTYIG